MTGEQEKLWYDSALEALEADVLALGGPKEVSALLWPARSPVDGAKVVKRILLDGRAREKFELCEIEAIVREAAKVGSRCYVSHLADQASCRLQPVEPRDELAELQRDFIGAVKRLETLSSRVATARERAAGPRR